MTNWTLTPRPVRVCTVQFVKEGLLFSGDDSPMANLLLSVLGAIAEFERSLIRERQLEGIAVAKRKGIYKGRKKALDDVLVARIKERIASGERKTRVARDAGISRQTLYGYLKVNTSVAPSS